MTLDEIRLDVRKLELHLQNFLLKLEKVRQALEKLAEQE